MQVIDGQGCDMGFVGRKAELQALQDWWDNAAERPALVWGRRRVGKTALIQHFASRLPRVVQHTGVGEPQAAELAALSRTVAAAAPDDLRDLTASPYQDWRDALDHLARLGEREPLLLVLDEFPELLAVAPALPGILRAFLDRVGGRTNLRILLCGSAVRTMWSLQEERAPLYGRFNLSLLLHPFRPNEAAAMLPKLSPADRALVYGILGGMPLYLSWWRPEQTVKENLLRLVGQPGSPLLTEGRLILLTEVGGDKASAVLYALAAGKTRHSEIQDVIGTDPTRILDRLIEARLVQRVIPVTEDPQRSRRRVYRVADNYLSFYLGPVLRYRNEIERGKGASILGALVRKLDEHMGPAFEEAFRDHLWLRAERGQLPQDIVAIGPWWQADGQNQIDAVALAEPDRTRRPVLVGEAKWSRQVDASRIQMSLAVKAAALTGEPESLHYVVCARDTATRVPEGVTFVSATDIFG